MGVTSNMAKPMYLIWLIGFVLEIPFIVVASILFLEGSK